MFKPPKISRKYKKIKYPDKFYLPLLENGKTIEQGLSELLDYESSNLDRDSARVQIYLHSLVINNSGKCELVYVSPCIRENTEIDFMNIGDNVELKSKIESWILSQTYNIKTLPKDFIKYKYSDFVYLK